MLKILQAMLQQYVNQELPNIQAGFRRGRGTRDQIANIHWIIEKAREFQKKTFTSASLTTRKPLTVWITTNCGKFFKRWEYQTTYLTCLLRNLYVDQEETETDTERLTGSKLRREVWQDCILSPCLFDFTCRVHHAKCQAGWIKSWNQNCREKYQQPQICRWYPYWQKVKRN